jgi:hypothetical protein
MLRSGVDVIPPGWVVVLPANYAPPLTGTSYISPTPAYTCGENAEPLGALLTVTATFSLPAGALDPGIIVLVHADNSVAVRLNGQLFGGQTLNSISQNWKGSPETYTTAAYAPDGPFVSNVNTLQFEFRNFYNPCALDFLSVVTFGFCAGPRSHPGGIFTGGPGHDILTGGPYDDIITGGEGNDAIDGGGGNDIIVGDAGDDTLFGGLGDDCLAGGEGKDRLLGNGGDDTLFSDAGVDILHGGAGNDLLDGGPDGDQLFGDVGNDALHGTLGSDVLHGQGGDDLANGGPGTDTIIGGTGDDGLIGGPDADWLLDPNGGDRDGLNGGDGRDVLNSIDGDGQDTLWGPSTGGPYGNVDTFPDSCLGDATDYAYFCP